MVLSIPSRTFSCTIESGETVLSALARNGIALSAPCGGRGLCGKCAVALSGSEGTRKVLACETKAGAEDLSIELPDDAIAGPSASDTAGSIRQNKAPRKIERAGIAFDIGTTTVSAELIDLDSGESLETVSALNDQRVAGADVMSRISAAREGRTAELFNLINRQIEGMIQSFAADWKPRRIEACAVSGNTTMLHLFANEDPSAMGEIPFTPKFLEARIYKGADLQLSADTVQLMPGISAFVGGDIVSDLAALDILGKKDKCLLVDIGTNGEMALWTGGKLLCTSTAAGPALEGAEISCGMGALPGAIDKIAAGENGALSFTTIGGAPPRGLCGCGLVDAVAAMLKTGALDETGLLADDCEGGFTIYDPARQGAECGCGVGAKAAGKKVSVSGKDVRQYQLAKSAIVSGIRLLCAAAGVGLAELETVFIAGGLGFFINIENAIATGLLPPEFRGKTAVCGNLSLRGAAQCLKSGAEFLARCAEIAAKSETYELASDPHFMEAFAENMLFE